MNVCSKNKIKRRPIDLSLKKPGIRVVANCLRVGARGICNFQNIENGVLVKVNKNEKNDDGTEGQI